MDFFTVPQDRYDRVTTKADDKYPPIVNSKALLLPKDCLLVFTNKTDTEVYICWQNEKGSLLRVCQLVPGESVGTVTESKREWTCVDSKSGEKLVLKGHVANLKNRVQYTTTLEQMYDLIITRPVPNSLQELCLRVVGDSLLSENDVNFNREELESLPLPKPLLEDLRSMWFQKSRILEQLVANCC